MSSVSQTAARPVKPLLILSLVVGLGTYAGRVWWHRKQGADAHQAAQRPHVSQLPKPAPLSPKEAEANRLPHLVEGYRLVSVVPEVKGHDLHALYENSHHVSLFIRPLKQEALVITARDLGRLWAVTEPVVGHPTFSRTDGHHRAALAWVARGNRHLVTGDVPLEQLRTFAVSYERALTAPAP